MAPSSFSTFPSSFSTFPDIEQSGSDISGDKNKRKKGESSSKNKDGEREKARSRSREEDKERYKERDRRDRRKDRDKIRPHGDRERRREQAQDKNKEKSRRESKHKHRDRGDWPKSECRAQSPSLDEGGRKYRVDVDAQTHDDSRRIFFTDTKGDPLTLQYGGIYAGDVPRYRLQHGGRQILGLSSSWSVFRQAGKGIEVGLRGTQKLPVLSKSSVRSLLALPPTKTILPSTSSSKYAEIDGFIRLSSRTGPREPADSYRAITTVRDSDSDSDISASSATEDDSENESTDSSPTLTSQQTAIKELERELLENPAAVDKWLTLLSYSLSTIPITSRNATKARSEITESVLSRALSADPKNSSSKRLLLRYMKAGEEIWQEARLRSEWENVLKVGGIEIWMEWLEWRTRSCTKNVDGLLDDVSRIYSAFDRDKGEAGELAKLRVLWRIAVIYKEAGFTEKAMAIFQAQAELTFKCPANLENETTEVRLSELEEFWESEVLRIGEEGAQGWVKWHDLGKPDAPPLTENTSAKRKLEQAVQLDPYRQWSFHETQQDQSSILPARSSQAVAELDPYTTVLFSDIHHILFEIKHPGASIAFRLAWLSFLGLHVPGLTSSLSMDLGTNWDDRWNMAYLTTQSYLDSIFPSELDQKKVMTESTAGVLVGREKEYAVTCNIPVREWGEGVIGCLDIVTDNSKSSRNWWSERDVAAVDVPVVRRIFAQLRMGNSDTAWDEMAIGFESIVNTKNSLKLSKSLISTAQGSLLHWAAHAQLERMRGRLDDARKVYHTVLILSKPPPTTHGAALLWYNWAELEWLIGKDDEVASIILRSVDTENANSGVSVLRAKRKLEDAARSLSVSTHEVVKMKDRESWVKLQALLEIVTKKDASAMLQVFDRHLQPVNGPDGAKESMVTASLVMLYRCGFVLKYSMPPTILRHRASVALEAYPSNSIILGIFLEGEKGQGVWGKVRGILGDIETDMGKMKDVSRRVEEVWIAGWEKGRWKGEIERTRSGLAGAVESERTRASPVIWRIYLEFEIRAGDLKRAKKLLYRAIGECPFCKGLYMLAFGMLRSVFTAQELNSLADLMAERRLRLRMGLDEILEGWDMNGIEELPDGSDGGESELEQRAEELRRLMPY